MLLHRFILINACVVRPRWRIIGGSVLSSSPFPPLSQGDQIVWDFNDQEQFLNVFTFEDLFESLSTPRIGSGVAILPEADFLSGDRDLISQHLLRTAMFLACSNKVYSFLHRESVRPRFTSINSIRLSSYYA